jgi:sulfite exporter TauE/SafE
VFVAAAGATASPFWGGLVMVAFWAGTVPVMAGLGLAAQSLLGPLRRRLPVVTAAALVVLGLLAMAGKLGVPTPLPAADCCKPHHAGH